MIDDWYTIPGARTTNPSELASYQQSGITPRPFREYAARLTAQLADVIKARRPFSLLRIGDAEFHFLDGEVIGNISVRHLAGKPNRVQKGEWLEHALRNDLLALNREPQDIEQAKKYVPASITADALPVPIVYALVATRELFSVAASAGARIGLIGNVHKMAVIRELMRSPEYRHYLGVQEFSEYVTVPGAGTAADYHATKEIVLSQMTGASDIYLVGMGIGKVRILDELRDETGKIFIDIGCGIDAIAGGVCHERPYFADWINYRIRGYSYTHIDELDLYTYDHRGYQFKSISTGRPWYRILGQQVCSKMLFFKSFRWRRFLARVRRKLSKKNA